MEKVKIQDKRTGAVKEVKKSLAGDYIGTVDFILYKETKKQESKPKYSFRTETK